jgi:AraC-like DNA-binding protein
VNLTFRQKLAGTAVGVALLAGAGGAYAISSGGANDRQAFLNDVAKRLNVSPEELKSAFRGALADRLAADVKAGRITQAEADRIKKEAAEHGGFPFPPPPGPPGPGARFGPPGPGGPGGPPPFGPPPHGPHGPVGAGLDAAAKYLGLTDLQLRRRLMSGKSLAQVAAEQKKPVDGLKSAIEAGLKKKLDQAVAGKGLTQAEEDRILTDLHGRLDDIVNRKPGDRPPPPGRGWRHRPHW